MIAYTVLHVVEGYVITPLLARTSVDLPPALTLAGQALLGELVGILGLRRTEDEQEPRQTIMLKMTSDETAKLINGATTDTDRNITYDP